MISMDRESWHQGRAAGLAGGRPVCPPGVADTFAYASGFVEGKALRDRRRAIRLLAGLRVDIPSRRRSVIRA
jgi:hypothetical protein